MSLETNKAYPNETYLTAGLGAATGGIGANAVLKTRLYNTAKKTTKAFNQTPEACDVFIKKHNNLLTKASSSKKGFFGKLNKTYNKMVANGENPVEAIKKTTSEVIDNYRNNAMRKLSPKLVGEELNNGINKISQKNITEDIYKSFKSVKKLPNIGIVFGATLLGAIGGCMIKEIVSKDKAPKETVKNNPKKEETKSLKEDSKIAAKKEKTKTPKKEIFGAKDDLKTKITKN